MSTRVFPFNIISLLHYQPLLPLKKIFVLQVGDIEGDAPSTKRLRRSSSDALQDIVGGEELSLYGSTLNKADSAQVCPHV